MFCCDNCRTDYHSKKRTGVFLSNILMKGIKMLIKNLTIWGLAREYAGIERKTMHFETGIRYGSIASYENG